MRNAVIDGEFEHLRINENQAAFLGRHAVQEGEDHRIDADRLARTGGAGDQQMRHAREIDHHRRAADVLAEGDRQLGAVIRPIRGRQKLAQEHGFALGIRHLDADHIAAGDSRDANGRHGQAAGDVIGQTDDPGGADAGRRLKLVERDDRAWPDLDDAALDAVVRENRFEQAGIGLQRLGAHAHSPAKGRFFEKRQRREAPAERQRRLDFGRQIFALLRWLDPDGGGWSAGRGRLRREWRGLARHRRQGVRRILRFHWWQQRRWVRGSRLLAIGGLAPIRQQAPQHAEATASAAHAARDLATGPHREIRRAKRPAARMAAGSAPLTQAETEAEGRQAEPQQQLDDPDDRRSKRAERIGAEPDEAMSDAESHSATEAAGQPAASDDAAHRQGGEDTGDQWHGDGKRKNAQKYE